MKLTPKQTRLLKKIIEPNSNEIYVQGSVQSGKTYVIALAVIEYTKKVYEYDSTQKYNGAIVGWDLDTLKGNIVEVIQNFMNELGYRKGIDYELKFGGNDKYFEFLNMRYYFFGFNSYFLTFN